jgi:1-aminocyclopropane-1-carboxylate synthase
MSIDVEKEAGCHPGRVHQLYGASKDFCLNGLRIGLFSQATLLYR